MAAARKRFISMLLALAPAVFLIGQSNAQQIHTYTDLCDASAASASGKEHFIVADDERNTLVIYKRNHPEPVRSLDLSGFLGTKEDKESDIEGNALFPEALLAIAGSTQILMLSDDGGVKSGGIACKDRKKSKQSFRALIVEQK